MVSEPLSDTTGSGGGLRPTSPFAYTERFKEVFPYYLAIGMTYDQFWNEDCELAKYYRQAATIKQELKNQDAWLQGMYIYEALCDVSPAFRAMGAKKPTPYRKEPYDLNLRKEAPVRKKKEKKQDDKAKAFMEMFMMTNNKKFETKGGEIDGRRDNARH